MMKLSKKQQELLDAMKGGIPVFFISGIDAYAFRGDTYKTVTKTVTILERKGLVGRANHSWGGCEFIVKGTQ